jgi:hypothetical protein
MTRLLFGIEVASAPPLRELSSMGPHWGGLRWPSPTHVCPGVCGCLVKCPHQDNRTVAIVLSTPGARHPSKHLQASTHFILTISPRLEEVLPLLSK